MVLVIRWEDTTEMTYQVVIWLGTATNEPVRDVLNIRKIETPTRKKNRNEYWWNFREENSGQVAQRCKGPKVQPLCVFLEYPGSREWRAKWMPLGDYELTGL